MVDKKWFTRRHLLLAVTTLLILVCVTTGTAQIAGVGSATRQLRVLVKVRGTLARDFEAALPPSNMTLVPGQGGSARVQTFMTRHAPRRVTPLYPDIVRRKQVRSLSDRQVADDTRQRFANRARRLRVAFQPPDISRTYALDMGPGSSRNLEQILRDLKADRDVEFAEEDRVISVNMTPNDPFFTTAGSWGQGYDDLWGTKRIGAPAAWDTGAGAGVVVAVVDTGIDYTHPDIAGNIWTNSREIAGNGIDDDGNGYIDDVRGWDFVGPLYYSPTESNDPIDHFGHGTHVAGTIAAIGNNGIGVIGVAWQAKIMIVKGLDDSGTGLESTLANAIMYAANNGADVINASWGGYGTSETVADAVHYAYNLGAVVVAAAGNSADDARNYYPANLEEAITVAAATQDDATAYFSNFGSKVDVAAPGTDILSLRAAGTSLGNPVDNDYTRASGTSMAAPHVSGVAALVLSRHPEYSNEDVRQAIRTSATDFGAPGYDFNFGYGGLNAAGAIAANNVLEAKISSPLDQTSVAELTTISGVARGSEFAYYTLEYGAGTLPTVWTAIQTSGTPTAGALGVFDATSVPNGPHTIRLTAYNASGDAFVDRIQLVVHSFFISSPVPPRAPTSATTFKPGAAIPILGSAGGTTFQSFQVDWAAGINPGAGWQTTGMTLTGGGLSPVSNGSLAAWDTSSLTAASAGYYTIRLRLTRAGTTAQALTIVYLEPDLLSVNWPQWLDQGPYFDSGTVPATNADGSVRLLVASPNVGPALGLLWTLTPQGTAVKTLLPGFGSFHQPSAANLDGNGGDEAVVSDTTGLQVFREDISSTTFTPGSSVDFMRNQDVIEDLDGDSRWDTLALGNDYNNNVASIYAWRPDGQLLNGNFPLQIADQNDQRYWFNRTRFIVGSLDGDGRKEIVALEGLSSSTYALRLFGSDGLARTWNAPVLDGVPFAMAAADLDHNGKLETIVDSYSGTQATLHVFQPDGSERSGWPVILENQIPTGQSFLAVGDLNRDGQEEIVLSRESELYVFKADGTLYSAAWPLRTGTKYGAVVLGDIDGDGLPEIVTTRSDIASTPDPLFPYSAYYDNKLIAIRRDGTTARSWQLTGNNGFDLYAYPTPAIGDFDQDGITDISVAYEVTGPGDRIPGVVTILSTGAAFDSSANDWPLLHLNARNTSTLILDRTPPSVSITSPSGGATVKGPVTIAATASDNAGVISVQFQVDGVNLGPAATAVPYSVVWDTSVAASGAHTLGAVAIDAVGNATASAPVSVVVGAPGGAFSTSALIYGPQLVNTSSVARSVTVTSTGTEALQISGFTETGDFSQTNNCAASLPPNAVCIVKITFAPTARGKRSGTIVLNSNISGPAPSISLTGTGFGPVAIVSPSSVPFAARVVDTASPSKSVTLTNTGDSTLHIQTISASGDFTQSHNCGTKLSAGGRCTMNVIFKPTAYGSRTGTLTITDDASGGSPQTVNLSGTGVDYSLAASPSGATATAGKSAAYTVTVAALAGAFGSAVSLHCANLPAASNCSFSPASLTPGSTSANSRLTISTAARVGHNGTPAGTYTVTITGTSGSIRHSTTVAITVK